MPDTKNEPKRITINRVKKSEKFTIIFNEIFERDDLSYKAKGILCQIFSLPDDWIIYMDELQKHSTDGERSFRSGWRELTEKGYIKRYPIKENGKIIKWQTDVYESVSSANKPHVQNAHVENVDVQNVELLSTNNTNYLNKQSTNNLTTIINNNNKIHSRFESEFGRPLSPIEFETIDAWIEEDKYDDEVIFLALREAVLNRAYSLKYIDKILLDWKRRGLKSKQDVEMMLNKRKKTVNNAIEQIPNELPKVSLFNWGEE